MRQCLVICLAIRLMAQDVPPTQVDIDVPPLAVIASGQPVGDDDIGFIVHRTGKANAFLGAVRDTSLWKGSEQGNASATNLVLRDNRWSQALVMVDASGIAEDAAAAEFRFRITAVETSGRPGTIRLHRMLVPWAEDASWLKPVPSKPEAWNGLRPGTDYEAEPFASVDLPEVKKGLVVAVPGCADVVNAWRSGRSANDGILVLYAGAGVQVSVCSREVTLNRRTLRLGDGGSMLVLLDRDLLARLLPEPSLLLRAQLVLHQSGKGDLAAAAIQAEAGDGPVAAVAAAGGGEASIDITKATRSVLADGKSDVAVTASGGTAVLAGPGDAKQKPLLRVTLRSGPKPELFPVATRIVPGVYAGVRDGHLWYGDRRLRLWGTLGSGSLDRLQRMGFNAYRFWVHDKDWYSDESGLHGQFAPCQPGDGSVLDREDKEFAYLKQHDIFVMSTALMRVAIPGAFAEGSFLADGGDWPAWLAAVKQLQKDKKDGQAINIAQLFDSRIQRMRIQAARNFLEHVNPYTGKRYADEEAIAIHEITNENALIRHVLEGGTAVLGPYFGEQLRLRWNDWLRQRYAGDAALAAAWGEPLGAESLAGNGVQLGPTGGERAKHQKRADDYARFMLELHRIWQCAFRDACRAMAKPGVGVAAVPFSFDTQFQPDLSWTYDNSWGDVQNFGMYFWDTTSLLSRPPSLYVEDSTTVAGKPTVIYETNHGRPGPYRGEFPFLLATFASWQDWDAIFFHYWGGPPSDTPDEAWLVSPVLYPYTSHFWTAVHTSTDPVMCAAIASAGRIFLSGAIRPAASPSIIHVGSQALLRDGTINVGSTAFARGARLAFDPDADFATRYSGPEVRQATDAVAAGDEIVYDWANGRMIVDTPTAKIIAGRTAVHRFRDGITVSGFDLPSTALAVVSADGRPLADGCTRAYVCAVADAVNTGFRIDAGKPLDGPINQAKAMIDYGRAPVIVQRPGWTLSFPSRLRALYTPYDFALRPQGAVEVGDGTLRRHGIEQWLGILDIRARGDPTDPTVDPMKVLPPDAALAGADDPATDPALADQPHPLAGVSWGDNLALAMRTLRERLPGILVQADGARGDPRRTLTLTGVANPDGMLQGVANVSVEFAGGRMQAVGITFTEPPQFTVAVSAYERRFGPPAEKRIDVQSSGSVARWKTLQGVDVVLQDVQGVVTVRWSR